MWKLKDLLDKNKLSLYLFVIALAFLIFDIAHRQPQVIIKPVKMKNMTEVEKLAKDNHDLRERLSKLEPASPVKIVTADKPSQAVETLPTQAIIAEGTRVPFETVYEDKAWVRPDYEPYWHSEQSTSESVADRVHNSYHRFFVTPGTESLWQETANQCGIAELEDKIKLPMYDDKPDNTLVVVSMQHQITDIIILNNQVVFMGTPSRTGAQVLAINKQDLIKSESGELLAKNKNQEYLFQLVTPDGYEVDYNTAVISF